MSPLFIFLIVLVVGFLGANLFREKLLKKVFLPAGLEYILIGILLGPSFSNWLNGNFALNIPQLVDDNLLRQMAPGIAAATGIIGLVYGLRFKVSDFQNADSEHIRVTIFDVLTSVLVIGGISFAVFHFYLFPDSKFENTLAAAAAFGLMGSVSSNSLIKSIKNRYQLTSKISSALDVSTKINLDINIFLFGLLFGIIHIGSTNTFIKSPIEWIVTSILLALLIGILLNIFLGREEDENKFFVAIIGTIVFTSGIGYFINISPLFMNFILGFILANFSKIAGKIEKPVTKLSEPVGILVVIMAGFNWIPVPLILFVVATAAFILIRFFSKQFAGYLAYASSFEKDKLVPNIGLGLLPQDIIVCAMVIDYINVYQNEFTNLVVSSILTSMIFFGLISYRLSMRLLIDAGEIRGAAK